MKAFSFVEIIIAVAIASAVFVAVFSLAFQNLSAAQLTRQRFIAAHLAQEGIEIVVNKRSSNWLIFPGDPLKWREGLGDGAAYIAQYNSTALASDPSNPPLVIDSDTSLYCHPSLDPACAGTASPYRRQIRISTISDHQMKVVSTVTWTYNDQTRSVSVEDRLYNWR
ncbi:MAG: hypothetical protein HY001_02695 [Candidatus Portnoybacteria bacterium]|nr:hypothetical protein [Candidatus Portnoybacteria bacterium]